MRMLGTRGVLPNLPLEGRDPACASIRRPKCGAFRGSWAESPLILAIMAVTLSCPDCPRGSGARQHGAALHHPGRSAGCGPWGKLLPYMRWNDPGASGDHHGNDPVRYSDSRIGFGCCSQWLRFSWPGCRTGPVVSACSPATNRWPPRFGAVTAMIPTILLSGFNVPIENMPWPFAGACPSSFPRATSSLPCGGSCLKGNDLWTLWPAGGWHSCVLRF